MDTGVLMTALVLNFVRMIQVPKQSQQEILQRGVDPIFLHDPNLRKVFLHRFSEEICPLRTTAHAIAEIHGLAKAKSRLALRSQHLGMFWRHSLDFLLAKDLEESLVRLIALKDQSDAVCEIGPSDTAIIHLVHKMGGVLLTTDRRLVGRAREQHVDVMLEDAFAYGAPIPSGLVEPRRR